MKSALQQLQSLHNPQGFERVGFILSDGEVIEVPNISVTPEIAFLVKGSDILKYGLPESPTPAIATWHTHPKKDANLTIEDHEMFLNYSHLKHYIVGTDGVRGYRVENGRVLND